MWQDLVARFQSVLDAAGSEIPFAPLWAVSFIILVAATAAAWLLHAAILVAMHRLLRGRRPYLQSVLDQTRNPTRLGLVLIALAIVLPTAPIGANSAGVIERVLLLGTICLIGWIAMTALHIGANLYLMRFNVGVADNLLARKHTTQVRVLLRVLDTIVVLGTLGFALMTFDAVRQFGVSLFASAGVAGLVFGLAAQPVLSNLIAGVQLAVTQPIRLEDAVTVQNEYGWIEEITSTYVVIRLWDLRRLIVPLSYFIEKPFVNWTRDGSALLGSVTLFLDYTAPIDRIRAKAQEIAAQSKLWNGKTFNVQVTDAKADAIAVRVLVSVDSASAANDLGALGQRGTRQSGHPLLHLLDPRDLLGRLERIVAFCFGSCGGLHGCLALLIRDDGEPQRR